MVKQIYSH